MGTNDVMRIISALSRGYLLNQVFVIIALYLIGYGFIQMIKSEMSDTWQCLLAFPAGLAAYGIVSFLLLNFGIEYEYTMIILFAVVITAELCLMLKKNGHDFKKTKWIYLAASVAIVAIIALICTSGLLSVSVDNDSMYYYSAYPEVLVKEKAYRPEFDVFPTDVGPMAVIINCLPYLFGFANTFGIQHFLNINFILFFLAAVYEQLSGSERNTGNGTAAMISVFATAFLATSAPFLTTAKWIMAGDYFMVYFFMLMYLGYKEGTAEERHEDMKIILVMFTVMLTMLRMEGVVMTAFLIICLSALSYSKNEMLGTYVFPMGFSAFLYYFMVFIRLEVRPLYAFLTPLKAVFMMLMITVLALYINLIRGKKLMLLQKNMNYTITGLLIAANLGMLAVRHTRYLTNAYMFFMNIRLRNGWGYFGYMLFLAVVLAVICAAVKKDRILKFWDVVFIGFILVTVGVSWARGSSLRIGAGDSGNRVMLTAAPVAVYALTLRFAEWFTVRQKKDV